MAEAIYKVHGGKMLRAEVRVEGGRIKEARITGDFFLHPEENISKIEQLFAGRSIPLDFEACRETLSLELSEAQLIGASPEDIVTVVRMACGE